MIRILGMFVVGCVVSGYFFPFSLSFLPESLNTKIILAILGVFLLLFESLKKRQISFSKELLGAAGLSILFSIVSLTSAEYNGTNDYSYADYFITFVVWVGGAYSVVAAIRQLHGRATIPILSGYLAAVSAVQCILAIIIDQNDAVKELVNKFVIQGVGYLEEVKRLYGIGASLDPAGIRFSIVLILISFTLIKSESVKNSSIKVSLFLLAFFIISVVGNMISRTTTTGMIFGFIIFFLSSGIHRFIIRSSNTKIYIILVISIIVAFAVLSFLYKTNTYYYDMLRFAFEGFFNWMETGVWRTDSTDKLDAIMWIWPSDLKTWLIGSGLFGNFIYSTDIGYCRFILYCGLIGFSIFVLFFVYNAVIFSRNNPAYRNLFFSLFVFALIVWLKVSTDIFLIFALFYWLDDMYGIESEEESATDDILLIEKTIS